MSFNNQELTEHKESHTKFVKGCEFCQADREVKTKIQGWDIIQNAISEMGKN
jgi:hypothetical protein